MSLYNKGQGKKVGGHVPTLFLIPAEEFFVLPTHFEEASYAPDHVKCSFYDTYKQIYGI